MNSVIVFMAVGGQDVFFRRHPSTSFVLLLMSAKTTSSWGPIGVMAIETLRASIPSILQSVPFSIVSLYAKDGCCRQPPAFAFFFGNISFILSCQMMIRSTVDFVAVPASSTASLW